MSILRILSLTACIIVLTGCSSFSGPGELKTKREFSNPFQSGPIVRHPTPQQYVPSGQLRLKWPVGKIKVSQTFRPRKNPTHEGVDFVHGYNAPILAAHQGYVVYVGSEYRGYGRMIIIEFNKRWASLYAHLEKVYVKEGDIVSVGQKIGSMGNTGRSTGVHLHFELLKNQKPTNPLPYLKNHSRVAHNK